MTGLLSDEYDEAEIREADIVHDFCTDDVRRYTTIDVPLIDELSLAKKQSVEDAFVIAQLLTEEECEDLIEKAEGDGMVPPQKEAGTLRTAKRTDRYQDMALSSMISSRIGTIFRDKRGMDSSSSFGDFHGIHENWRILRYDSNDSFPAHQDQMDSIRQVDKRTGKPTLLASSHTMLINLSRDGLKGGATRFYPKCRVAGKSQGQYEFAIDVILPRGWALVFPQIGMVHAGQPIKEGQSKYVAQAGVLRNLPPTKVLRPSVFRLGPGLQAQSVQ